MSTKNYDVAIAATSLLKLIESHPSSSTTHMLSKSEEQLRKGEHEDRKSNLVLNRKATLSSTIAPHGNELNDSGRFVPNRRQRVYDDMRDSRTDIQTILMNLLMTDMHKDTLSFLPNSNSFMIDCESFKRLLMPRYFCLSSFGAFVKKLERRGFIQDNDPTIPGSHIIFSHPYFRKDNLGALRQIKCVSKRSRGQKYGLRNPSTFSIEGCRRNLRRSSPKIYSNNREHAMTSSDNEMNNLSPVLKCASPTVSEYELYNARFELTKDVIADAVQCLLNDEDHTMDLLARRGHELMESSDYWWKHK